MAYFANFIQPSTISSHWSPQNRRLEPRFRVLKSLETKQKSKITNFSIGKIYFNIDYLTRTDYQRSFKNPVINYFKHNSLQSKTAIKEF